MVGCMTLKEKKYSDAKNHLNEQKGNMYRNCSLLYVDSYML